jgi:predicted dehydrogenase
MAAKPLSPSRRSFVKNMVSTAAATTFAAPAILRAADPVEKPAEVTTSSKEKLRLAFIGTGGIGGMHMDEFPKHGITVPCYCDVDSSRWGEAKKRWPEAKGYQDYREMIDKQGKDFDAVVVGTPDHHHYPATILAMQAGKATYTQKPLTHTVWEARQLALAAKKYRVATQMGNQGHGGEGWRLLYEWVRSGSIGTIKEVHSWTDRPIWPQGINRPEGEDPVPASLNWDVWIGPAPMRPFKKDVYHPFAWRGWWDFGAGALGDMAAHTMDGMFWALDAFDPVSVEPTAMTEMNGETFPKAGVMKWHFAAKGDRPAFDGYWYEGGLRPQRPAELEADRNLPKTGNLFIGTKATIMVAGDYGNSPRIIPETKSKEIGKPPKMLERSPGNYAEWVQAAKGEKPLDYCKSNFAYAGPMTECMILGNIAMRTGRKLEWDAANLKVTNVPEANQYVNKEYRQGWKYEV